MLFRSYPQEYQEALEASDGNEENAIGLLREQTEAREKARRFRESREAISEKLDNNEQLTAGDVRILASEDILGPDLYKAGYRLDKSTGNWNHMNSDQAPNKYKPIQDGDPTFYDTEEGLGPMGRDEFVDYLNASIDDERISFKQWKNKNRKWFADNNEWSFSTIDRKSVV